MFRERTSTIDLKGEFVLTCREARDQTIRWYRNRVHGTDRGAGGDGGTLIGAVGVVLAAVDEKVLLREGKAAEPVAVIVEPGVRPDVVEPRFLEQEQAATRRLVEAVSH